MYSWIHPSHCYNLWVLFLCKLQSSSLEKWSIIGRGHFWIYDSNRNNLLIMPWSRTSVSLFLSGKQPLLEIQLQWASSKGSGEQTPLLGVGEPSFSVLIRTAESFFHSETFGADRHTVQNGNWIFTPLLSVGSKRQLKYFVSTESVLWMHLLVMQVPVQGRREKAGGLWQGYRLCDCIRKHSDSSVFGVLGAVLCCWEMWQPFPSLHNLFKTDVNAQWANTAPVAVAGADLSPNSWACWSMCMKRGVKDWWGRTGSGMWQFLLTLFPDPPTGAVHTFSYIFISNFHLSPLPRQNRRFFPSTLALRSAGLCKTVKSPPWGVEHEWSFPLRSKQMTNSPSKIKDVFFQWKNNFRINSVYTFYGDFWQV